MKHCYQFPRPAVTTDCVIFCYDKKELKVLLIRRVSDPFKGKWAFPGGFLQMDENADTGALRELSEETGIRDVYIEQIGAFSDIDRDPRGRTVTIAFIALIRSAEYSVNAGDDAAEAGWFPVIDLPPLAFDHDLIMSSALGKLQGLFRTKPAAFELLPEKFTLPDLQDLCEIVLRRTFDRRNFRKRVLNTGFLIDLHEIEKGAGHRGARYYSFDKKKYREISEVADIFDLI